MLAQAARSPRASAMLPTRMNFLRPRDRYLLVEGLRLHVLDWGGDGRTPLLLLHGFTGHAHAWDTLSIALQPHVHVYALDARGHGDSDPADTYTAAAAFDDRSEEHTSELQSQSNLVCRLLLEKKKRNRIHRQLR